LFTQVANCDAKFQTLALSVAHTSEVRPTATMYNDGLKIKQKSTLSKAVRYS